ncbi:PLDc N-terminal domain-containing protein [Cloacibacterium sp. Arc13]|uniref:PLDc N-terminal domain-containing protein n=1 Tax=unclassified Cloacibacterium TaxID=2620870 RepID=UPI00352C7E54
MILTFLSLSILHLVFVLFIILLPSVLWIFAIIDILKSNFKDSTNKIIWVLIVLLLPVLGSILYFIFAGQQKTN